MRSCDCDLKYSLTSVMVCEELWGMCHVSEQFYVISYNDSSSSFLLNSVNIS